MTLQNFGTIVAHKRGLANKNYLKTLRINGKIPAVVYGIKPQEAKNSNSNAKNKCILAENMSITVDTSVIEKLVQDPSVLTRIFKLEIDKNAHSVVIKDISYDPLTDAPTHVDFLYVNENSICTCIVPIRAVNVDNCPDMKRGASVFMLNYNAKVTGLIKHMPNSIDVDVEFAKIGDIFSADSKKYLPEGCKFVNEGIALLKVTGKKIVETAESTAEDAKSADAKTKAPVAADKGGKK
jgi:large subunit ribosomal protein L25